MSFDRPAVVPTGGEFCFGMNSGAAPSADGAARRRLPIASVVPASKRTGLMLALASEHLADGRVASGVDEIHYFQKPIYRQFPFATERQSDSSRALAEGSPECKHQGCRSGGNAVVVIPASGSDDERRCIAGFCLAILNGVRGGAGAPWRSRRRRAGQNSSPVLACIIGALRPCMAPMISSDEIPSR